MKSRRLFLAILFPLLLCPTLLPAATLPRLQFSPVQWKFGTIVQGATITLTVTVTNLEPVPVTVTFVPTCTCLSVKPAARKVGAGKKGAFELSYESSDDTGNMTRGYIVRTDLPDPKPLYYFLRGTVRQERTIPAGTGGAAQGSAPAGAPGVVTLSYYYTPGCRSCEEFLSVEIPRLEKKLGISIVVQRKDVLDAKLYEELSSLASARGLAITAMPVVLIGETLLQGDQTIRDKLPGVLSAIAVAAAGQGGAAGTGSSAASAGASQAGTGTGGSPFFNSAADRLAVLPIIAAGLIDGINPCAFTTLIFLLASLALAGRGRREVLLIGALFSVAVFLTYFLIGLGFFAALRAAATVSLVSVILRWVLVAVLLVFAGLSVYDYLLIRKGRPTEILLQLPSALKKRIHASIRTRVHMAAIAGSSLVLGFLVSVFEFACTGQVYLPMLGYLVRVHRQAYALSLLGLYNLCFIVPLLVVFGASYMGVSSARITTSFQTHMGKVKLGLAVVFVGLAVFTLVG